ncbi:hypothetical protein K0817_017250 [Microbacterium sp. HD4P20]|uniref:hypothetical protein n=1 Tax=Microbacterium sp. HD4P20 TaxID=2864874 RepID=UPI001C63D8BB|nr:hypothetical protein [Microbacterium sp. HD4P20]MCP2638304.1 hypothetical protein [Microbacterium sp. HD4P20]
MPQPGAAYPFDARPLVEPVDPAAARAFAHELRRTGRLPSANVAAIVGITVLGIVFLSVFLTMVGTIVAVAASAASEGIGFLLLTFIPVVVLVVIVAGAVVAAVVARRGASARMLRLDRFARANGMSYLPRLANPGLPGMIFSLGSSRQASDLVRGERPRFVEFANYRYTTGSGKNRTTHKWGYVAVKLDVPLPHIVLDATGNNGLFGSNLPATFDKDQRLSLEGDFDRYFSLSCPAGYETDALYLFTPDIMARFIDNAAALDVEIVDDWLFLYAKRDFSTLDPATWAWLFSVVGALLDKFAQWARWRDERLRAAAAASTSDLTPYPGAGVAGDAVASVPFSAPLETLRPPPGVAQQGRRLQRGVPWVTFVAVGAVVLFWLLSQAGVFGFFFSR